MEKTLTVEITITKSGFLWSSPVTVKVQNVPPEKYEKLMELMLAWSKEFTEPKK